MKISIITCTYNASAVVERTLMSVLAQSYPHVEHIIIDGASKDDTLVKVHAYKEKSDALGNGHEVVVVSEPDKGLYDAMNKGIRYATGDYLVFLNAGDKFATECVDGNGLLAKLAESCAECAEGNAIAGVLYGDTNIVDETGMFLHKRRLSPPEHLTWRSFKHGMLVCHQSFYARTEIAKEVAFNLSYRFSADVDWCIRIMKEAERRGMPLHNTHLTLTDYLDGGLTVKNHRASLMERFNVMRCHYGLLTTVMMHMWFVVRSLVK